MQALELDRSIARMVRESAPPRIDDLWEEEVDEESSAPPDYNALSLQHFHARYIEHWPNPDAKATSVLEDPSRCGALATALADATFTLGSTSERLRTQLPNNAILVSPCNGCNTPYDAGGCVHPGDGRAPPLRIRLDGSAPWHHPVNLRLHRSVKLLEATSALLAREDGGAGRGRGDTTLADLLVPEAPPGMATPDFARHLIARADDTGERGILPLVQLVGVLDNCSSLFPRAAQYAAGVLSLAVCHRPAVALALLDPDMVSRALYRYLGDVFDLVNNSECIVEETFGIVAFINLLPLLYFLSDWKEARKVLMEHKLPSTVATVMINILHSASMGLDDDDDRIDRAPDLEKMPELSSAVVVVGSLIGEGERGAMLRDRPMSFAVAASLEVLGRWSRRGIPVSEDTIPTSDVGPEPVSVCVAEYLDNLDRLADRTPAMAAAVPVAAAIASGERAKIPEDDESILKQPLLRVSMRCSLRSCSRTTAAEGGGKLLLCDGGCGGLARYCCRDHQLEHWHQHKFFCKRQDEYAGERKKRTKGKGKGKRKGKKR